MATKGYANTNICGFDGVCEWLVIGQASSFYHRRILNGQDSRFSRITATPEPPILPRPHKAYSNHGPFIYAGTTGDYHCYFQASGEKIVYLPLIFS